MTITTPNGTMTLDDDAKPSIDDMNDIIASVTRDDDDGSEFQALCDAATSFGDDLNNYDFRATCEAWLEGYRSKVPVLCPPTQNAWPKPARRAPNPACASGVALP